MNRKDEIIDELMDKKPTVSLELYALDIGEEGKGGMALHLNFGEDGPPKSLDDASMVQAVSILLSQKFTEIMEDMQGSQVTDDEEVLSSCLTAQQKGNSQVKDEIDEQLKELGITPPTNNEAH